MYFSFKKLISITIIFLFISCNEEQKVLVGSKNELYVFLDSFEEKYENLYSSFQIEQKLNFPEIQLEESDSNWIRGEKIFLDTSIYNTIMEWHDRAASLADKELSRRLELWHKTFQGGKLYFDPEIQQLRRELIKKYKEIQNNKKVLTHTSLVSRLQNEKYPKRRKIIFEKYYSDYTDIIPDYVQLVKLCNTRAQESGFPNYYSFLLYLDGIDEAWLLETIDNLDQLSRSAYFKLLDEVKKKYKSDNIAPWDIDPIFRNIPDFGSKYFPGDSIITKIIQFMKTSGAEFDSSQIKITIKKNLPQSKCFIIKVPDNVEVVIGTEPGLSAYHSALQSLSEALFASSIDVKYPILKGYTLIPGTAFKSLQEGSAQTFSLIFDDSLNLIREFHVKQKDLERYLKMRTDADLYNIRILIRNFYMEYRLYQNPEQNLDSLASITYKEFLCDSNAKQLTLKFIPAFEFINCNGDIYKNILREIISAQLYEGIVNKFGSENRDSTEIAPWLIETLHRKGELRQWQERIRIATGKSLEPGALLRKLKIEQTNIITQ